MSQRWLASVMLHCEKGFKRIKGFALIPDVLANIEAGEIDQALLKNAI